MKDQVRTDFVRYVEEHKNEMKEGKSYSEIMNLYERVEAKVRELFPMNQIPQTLVSELTSFKTDCQFLESQMQETLDLVIHEVKKLDGLE